MVGHPLKYRASPLKYGVLTLYLVDLQGSTGSNRELPRLLQGIIRYITQTYERGLRKASTMLRTQAIGVHSRRGIASRPVRLVVLNTRSKAKERREEKKA
jgi:hypothetical protein